MVISRKVIAAKGKYDKITIVGAEAERLVILLRIGCDFETRERRVR
jgi:hypothetical protein